MEIIIYLIVFVAGAVLGWYRGLNSMARLMLEDPEKFQELMREVNRVKAEAKLDEDMGNDRETVIDVEREQGIYYAYSDKGEFLAQGPDFRSMIEVIKQRFPGRSFRINKYNPKLTEEETQRLILSVYDSFGKTPPEELNQKT